jgi:nucleoid-associated protein YgaU
MAGLESISRREGMEDPKQPQKPRPDFSDVQSGGSSTARPVRPTPEAPNARTYTVVKGDNLSKIAKHFYGKANAWQRIYEANKDTIKDPNLIYPGQVLEIPND